MRLANQRLLTSWVVPVVLVRPCSGVGANLVLKKGSPVLKSHPVPAVQKRQKVDSSTISSGTMKRFPRCERP